MIEQDRPAYCRQCGSPVQSEDVFCGTCGAAVLPPAPKAEQVIPQPVAASKGEGLAVRRIGRPLLLAGALGALVMMLIGGSILILLGFGFGSVSSDAPPDPAFDLPLQVLERWTDAPITLPAELPNELGNVAIDENYEGDRYGVLFKDTPPEDLVEPFVRYNTVATLVAVPESEYEPSDLFEATSTESVRLPDGTEATLRRMEPVEDGGNYGPYWEGAFTKDRYTYTLSVFLGQDGQDISEQALSTMVEVER